MPHILSTDSKLLQSNGQAGTATVITNHYVSGDGTVSYPVGLTFEPSDLMTNTSSWKPTVDSSGNLSWTLTDNTDPPASVNIKGQTGPQGEQGPQGPEGADGQSVTFDITNIASGHRVTLSGAQGSSSFDVMNGDDGVDGVSPTFRFQETEDGVTVIVSGAQGESAFSLYNGTSGTTYSAGSYIDIYDVEGQKYISANVSAGTPWISGWKEIGSLSLNFGDSVQIVSSHDFSGYHNHSIGLKGAVVTLPSTAHIGSALDDKLDASAFSSVSGTFLTAHQDVTNLPYVQNSALGYTPSTFVSSISGHELYAESANHAFTAETANFVEGGWEYSDNKITGYGGSAFSAGSTYDVSAGANINVATAGNTFTVSGKDWTDEITAASAYAASQAQGKTYTGVAPIVVNNNEDKISADCARLSAMAPLSMTDQQVGNVMYTKLSADCIELSAGNGIDSNKLATGVIEVSGGLGGGVAISGQYNINGDTINVDCSAFGMYEQANSTGSYQLMATANNGSWHGYGYTMSNSETVLMSNVSSVAQNYAASAVSSHIRLIHYPDITFSAVRDTFRAGGIVVPYETTQGYSTFYNFVASSVADSTSSYKFDYIGTNGYATILTVSSYNDGATTGVHRDYRHIFLSPSECECKVVLVATSGDIPASGATDGKLYVVTGSGT